MPVAKEQKPKAAKPAPKPVAKVPPVAKREVLYPDLRVNGILIPEENLKVNFEKMVILLELETEEEWTAKCGGVAGLVPPNGWLPDPFGGKVTCHNNVNNRRFDERHCAKLAQDILDGKWELNGEAMIISRTAVALSLQHRGMAFYWAVLKWRRNPEKYQFWTEEPHITALVVTGISDSQEVVQSIDQTRPRSDADAIYTSGVFDPKLDPKAKDELSRMLAAATDMLWDRTEAGGDKGTADEVYKTHGSLDDFRVRHNKLLECIKHVFEENQERSLSKLKLSPGKVAAALFLMGSSASDVDAYRNYGDRSKPRTEENLDWSLWDKATEFVSLLGTGPDLANVRTALGKLLTVTEEQPGLGGRDEEKMAVLARAWGLFKDDQPIAVEDVMLLPEHYATDDAGSVSLADDHGFGGIDALGQDDAGVGVTREEAATGLTREQKRAEEDQRLKDRIAAARADKAVPADPARRVKVDEESGFDRAVLERLKAEHPNELLLFREDGGLRAWQGDAARVCKALKSAIAAKDGMNTVFVPPASVDGTIKRLLASHKVLVFDADGGNPEMPVPKASAKPAANGKPKAPAKATPAQTKKALATVAGK